MATAIAPCACDRPRVVWNETAAPGGGRRLWLRCMSCGRGSKPVDGERTDPELPRRAREAWMRQVTVST